MRWYLLRDRRHEGPFTKEQVVVDLRAGKIDSRDYLLPEQAVTDQSSFAYISVADVVGPEVVFDLKAKSEGFQPRSPQKNNPADETRASALESLHAAKHLEELKSEFAEGLESSQLIRIKNSHPNIAAMPPINAAPSFISSPSTNFEFPWKLASVIGVMVLLALGATLLKDKIPLLSFDRTAAEPNSIDTQNSKTRAIGQNRVPTGHVQLPPTTTRASESLSQSRAVKDYSQPEERRKNKKKRSSSRKEAVTESNEDGIEASNDSENFDEDKNVDDDVSDEEDTDESDI